MAGGGGGGGGGEKGGLPPPPFCTDILGAKNTVYIGISECTSEHLNFLDEHACIQTLSAFIR